MQKTKLNISFSNIKPRKLTQKNDYSLNNNEIAVYSIYLPNFFKLQALLSKYLDSTEHERISRFHYELDKTNYIIYRSILKFILAAHTKIDVKNIVIGYRSNKKPYLISEPSLKFNISHSADFASIAISNQNIGIDIEYISDHFNYSILLHDIFNKSEISAIQNSNNLKKTFYTLWTRKEAFVKALGKGIDDDFKTIPCLDGEHTIDSSIIQNTNSWHVNSFEVSDRYICAVAFEKNFTSFNNIVLHSLPNTIDELYEMIQTKNN